MTPDQSGKYPPQESAKASPLHLWRGIGGEVDLNCDLGEGMNSDKLIMPFISSVNVACGYHAGDEKTIWKTIELAVKNNVAVGAHVSFLDKDNFGRTEIKLPAEQIYELVEQQLIIIKEIADSFNVKIHHVKPHGALYNMSARDEVVAKVIAESIKDFDANLILFGLSGSYSINKAEKTGLKTASEVFADRTYQDDGTLTSRSMPDALIEDADKAVKQTLQMIKKGTVTSVSGKEIPIKVETVCIHGDGEHAVEFAQRIFSTFQKEGIKIQSP
jgi:5-oxoprolinase (ATP-hydrolysing) subunit A